MEIGLKYFRQYLQTILIFPYVGAAGRVCTVVGSGVNIGVEFSTPCNYLHDCGGVAESYSGWWCLRRHLEFIPDDDNLPDIWEYI